MPIVLTHVSPPPVRWWRTGGQPCGVCAIISAWLSEFTVTDHRRVCSLSLLLVPSSANTDRFLGEQYNLHAEWQATAHINVNGVYVHFTPAGFLKSSGAKGIDYVGIWTAYIF
jgi:hypothetical protein